MVKALVTLCCILAMGTPVFAGGESDAKAFTAVYGSAEEESVQDFVQTVQWGGRMWTCVARGRSGRTFLGQSRNANAARRIALNRCRDRSSGCFIRNCR
jgi:hypothetical protein